LAATADMIIERRRVRRRLAFWRIVAIIAIVVAAIGFLPSFGMVGEHIARVNIDGLILDDEDRERELREIADDRRARALIVHVNSPGGTVAASEAVYLSLRKIAEKKPVVAVMDEYAASGGYIAALAGERIVARGNTLTGSIGVVMEAPNVAGLLDKLGVEVTRIKSGPLKAEPSLTTSPSPEALRAQEALIADTFAWFRGLVAERRALDGAALERVTDGRAFTGRQAVELGLVDELGDEETALAWLSEAHGIDSDLAVVERNWDDADLPWPFSLVDKGARAFAQLERLAAAGPRLYALIR
jgi:protease IV